MEIRKSMIFYKYDPVTFISPFVLQNPGQYTCGYRAITEDMMILVLVPNAYGYIRQIY